MRIFIVNRFHDEKGHVQKTIKANSEKEAKTKFKRLAGKGFRKVFVDLEIG